MAYEEAGGGWELQPLTTFYNKHENGISAHVRCELRGRQGNGGTETPGTTTTTTPETMKMMMMIGKLTRKI